jgi:hypothetical protein
MLEKSLVSTSFSPTSKRSKFKFRLVNGAFCLPVSTVSEVNQNDIKGMEKKRGICGRFRHLQGVTNVTVIFEV